VDDSLHPTAAPIPESKEPADRTRITELEEECKWLSEALAETNAQLRNVLAEMKRMQRLLKKLNTKR
jgi:uncharacterized coiled-coil protein SlyX